jgi:excisionase family DNA binding protein
MARKFVDLEEAAKMLGVTPDTLTEMRERQKIYGYRDGGSWKFKPEDVERLIADRESAEQEGDFAEMDEDPDSILLSEVELGGSNESTSSTIIGGKSSRNDPAESDIQLAKPKHDSDVDLDAPLQTDAQGGSDVLAEPSKKGSGVSPLFDELDTLDLEMDSAADSGISSKIFSDSAATALPAAGTSDIALGSDALKLEGSALAFGDDDALQLGEDSGIKLSDSKAAGGSAIDLTGDEDGDLVLGGSSHGDLSRSGDSGINLLNPADSGLSLESAPLALGGSAVESLELGEEDAMLGDDLEVDSPGARTQVGAQPTDDDFLLTPLEEAGVEESDSGSQVIALEGDVEFEDAGPSTSSAMFEAAAGGGGGLLDDDLSEGLSAAGALSAAALTPAAATGAAAGGAPAVVAPEPAYSGWNVASLALCAMLLLFVGMFMFDLLRNMWSWNSPYPVNSWLMSSILSWFEK